MKLLGIEVTLEEFDYLICEQNKGKELVVENGNVVARDRVITQQEINKQIINELVMWFDNYFDKQFKQSQWQKNFKVSEDPYFKDENGNPKIYADIEELKEKAELVASEIRKLREELNNVNRL